MKNDPAIQRVREARHAVSAECGHDPEKLVAYYLKRQQERLEQQKQADKEKQDMTDAEAPAV